MVTPLPAAPAPGEALGDYRLGEQIGSGGMGRVYRAYDLRRDRVVAIKVLREGATDRRFQEEGRVLAQLDHPGLITVLDSGHYRDRPYLVLPYVAGQTLRERMSAGPLPPDEVAGLGAGLADALAHAHAVGVVHRDVKPSNIMIDEHGRPVLGDFGISYQQGRTRWTATGFVNGTAAYLAPEQVRGDSPDAPLDVYALGLVLLECLTGEVEYEGNEVACAVARLHRAPRRPVGAPDWLAAVLAAMTEAEPADRPTARQCADCLATGSFPDIVAFTGQPPRSTGRRRALIAGGVAAAAAAATVVALVVSSPGPGTGSSGGTGTANPVPSDAPVSSVGPTRAAAATSDIATAPNTPRQTAAQADHATVRTRAHAPVRPVRPVAPPAAPGHGGPGPGGPPGHAKHPGHGKGKGP